MIWLCLILLSLPGIVWAEQYTITTTSAQQAALVELAGGRNLTAVLQRIIDRELAQIVGRQQEQRGQGLLEELRGREQGAEIIRELGKATPEELDQVYELLRQQVLERPGR